VIDVVLSSSIVALTLRRSIATQFAAEYSTSQNLDVLADFVEINPPIRCCTASRGAAKMLIKKSASLVDVSDIDSPTI